MKYGLILPQPVLGRDYIQDSPIQLAGVPLVPNGQWDEYLPGDELQAQYFETLACATFGTLNAVEILERKCFGKATDWSDRYLARKSNTTKRGNDPHKVAETLRNHGTVPQEYWPYDESINTWEKFYADIPADIMVQAQVLFKGNYNLGHQYVKTDPTSMMDALTRSPLGVDVDAWQKEGPLYVRRNVSNHWCVCYGFRKGKYWKILDTYDNTKKKLAWDYGFTIVKQYTLDKRVEITDRWHPLYLWWQAILFFRRLLGV